MRVDSERVSDIGPPTLITSTDEFENMLATNSCVDVTFADLQTVEEETGQFSSCSECLFVHVNMVQLRYGLWELNWGHSEDKLNG